MNNKGTSPWIQYNSSLSLNLLCCQGQCQSSWPALGKNKKATNRRSRNLAIMLGWVCLDRKISRGPPNNLNFHPILSQYWVGDKRSKLTLLNWDATLKIYYLLMGGFGIYMVHLGPYPNYWRIWGLFCRKFHCWKQCHLFGLNSRKEITKHLKQVLAYNRLSVCICWVNKSMS